jgi:hypothetical protein
LSTGAPAFQNRFSICELEHVHAEHQTDRVACSAARRANALDMSRKSLERPYMDD